MAKKKFGQNFLINENLCEEILKYEKINNNNILEVGSGNLALTTKIINKNPKKFFSLEIDDDLIEKHKNSLISKYIYKGDALNINELDLFNKDKFSIISNLPFNISSKLLIKWLRLQNDYRCIQSMTLMFQKELADRILAKENEKKYGRITVLVNAFFALSKIVEVNKKDFYPRPKVDATVIKFSSLKNNKIKKENFQKLEKITFSFFNERRKKNINKIKKIFSKEQIRKEELDKYFSLRPENLNPNIYYLFSEII